MESFVTHDDCSGVKGEFRATLSKLEVGQAETKTALTGIQNTLTQLVEKVGRQNGRIGALEQASAAGRGGLRTACWFVGISLSLMGIGVSAGWVLFRVLGLSVITG